MRDEKEERKKQARSNKQIRQSNTAHPRQSLFLEKMSCLRCREVYTCIYLFRVDVVSIGGTVHSRLHHSRPWPTLPLMQARKFLTSPHSRRHCYMHLDYSHTQILLQYIPICGTRGCTTVYHNTCIVVPEGVQLQTGLFRPGWASSVQYVGHVTVM